METARPILKPFSVRDLEEIHTLWTDPDMGRRLFDDEITSKEKVRDFLLRSDRDFEGRGYGLWGVRRR